MAENKIPNHVIFNYKESEGYQLINFYSAKISSLNTLNSVESKNLSNKLNNESFLSKVAKDLGIDVNDYDLVSKTTTNKFKGRARALRVLLIEILETSGLDASFDYFVNKILIKLKDY